MTTAALLNALSLVLLVPPSDAGKPKPPNVLVLFSDDQRHDTIHALGNDVVRTPHLDRLARHGFVFRNAAIMGSMGGAVCMPSRAMLMSGRTLWHVPGDLKGAALWPETMGRAGYTAFGTGKWHNGPASYARAFRQGGPVFFGGMWDHNHMPVFDFDPSGRYPKRNERIDHKFSSELFADAAVEFLRNHKGAQPFFLYVAFTAPHDPRTPPGEYARMYDPQKMPLPRNFLPEHPFDNGELKVRDEQLAPWPRTPDVIRRHLADYYGMISHLDAQIGRILKTLDDTGHTGDTLVIFASDNGLALGSHGLLGKQSLYEHSQRVPLILAGPNIPAAQSRALVYLYDLFPTVCDLTGVAVPEGIEGKSLVPILRGRQRQVRDHLLGVYREFQRSIREPRWKLIEYHVQGRRTSQLFDLESDPDELVNLADSPAAQEHRKRLEGLLKKGLREADDPVRFW